LGGSSSTHAQQYFCWCFYWGREGREPEKHIVSRIIHRSLCVCSTGASASIIIATLHQQQQLDEHTTHPKLLIMGSCRSPVLSSPMQLPLARPPRAGSASPPPRAHGEALVARRQNQQEERDTRPRAAPDLPRAVGRDDVEPGPDDAMATAVVRHGKDHGPPGAGLVRWVRASRGRDPCALESPARRTVTSAAPMRAACLRPRAPRPRRGTRACLAGRPTRTSP
jgi:hypothetical protein